MKPWEETWTAQRYVIEMADEAHRGRSLGQFIDDDDDPENPSCDRDRAQLAAAAPEMARLLLTRADNTDSGRDDVDWYCFACHQGGGHAPDCRLVAVLRKAGVM